MGHFAEHTRGLRLICALSVALAALSAWAPAPAGGTPLVIWRDSLTGPGTSLEVARPAGVRANPFEAPGVARAWVTVLCKFADDPAEPRPPSYFTGLMGSAAPGLDHYWREQSYDAITLAGSTVVGWFTLPQARAYYVDGNGLIDLTRAATDCTQVADASVFFPAYYGVNTMFNGTFMYAMGGTYLLNIDSQSRLYGFTWLPNWGWQKQSVVAHEMGHGFGFPHSVYNPSGAQNDNFWDLMSVSSGPWNCIGVHVDPTYGCLGQHTLAYNKQLSVAGWIPPARVYTYAGSGSVDVTLERVAQPPASGYLIALVQTSVSTISYTVEVRAAVGYDQQLPLFDTTPNAAVIIHELDSTRGLARVVDSTAGNGDEGQIWRVGEVFEDAGTGARIAIEAQTATGFVVHLGPRGAPTTTSLYPAAAPAGGAGFTLVVSGAAFAADSVVRWNGAARATTFSSANEVRAQILASDIATAGPASVTVFTPAPGGGLSNAQTFSIMDLPVRVYLPASLR